MVVQSSVKPERLKTGGTIILNDPTYDAHFTTIQRLAREINEPLGALVNEPAPLNAVDVQELRTAIGILQRLLSIGKNSGARTNTDAALTRTTKEAALQA